MIANAKTYNKHPNCYYHVNLAENLSIFGDDCFDVIYSNITLQHMESNLAQSYLKEFIRLLRPEGIIVFQLPSHPRPTTKGIIIRLVPDFVLDVLRGNTIRELMMAFFGKHRLLRMKMRGMRKEQVIQILEDQGARVVDVCDDSAAGCGWYGYRYFVTK